MNSIDIRIARLNHPGPLFPEYVADPPDEVVITSMGILEGGTESGRTSICLFMVDDNGVVRMAQVSAAMFHAMNGALSGAEQRFQEEPL